MGSLHGDSSTQNEDKSQELEATTKENCLIYIVDQRKNLYGLLIASIFCRCGSSLLKGWVSLGRDGQKQLQTTSAGPIHFCNQRNRGADIVMDVMSTMVA